MSEHHARAGQEPSESSDLWAGAEVNFRYTRAQALADGVLIAVPAALVTEAGFRWPIALTAAAWADAVAWNEHTEARKPSPTGQDETGRLWACSPWPATPSAQRRRPRPRLWCRCSGCRLPAGPCVPS